MPNVEPIYLALAFAAFCCFMCVVTTVISVAIWRRIKSADDLNALINSGQSKVNDVESKLSSIRASVDRIEEHQVKRDEQVTDLQESIARIEAKAEESDKHTLRPRDLGGLHEKINSLGIEVAGMKERVSTQHRALSEQIGILQAAALRPRSR